MKLIIDNKEIITENERNLLEVIRKAGIDLPTFCYYSEMSIYGSCRLCMVEVEGRGLVPSCSTLPEDGMVVRTNTEEIRKMRKIIVELLLANHAKDCTTCSKNTDCKLQTLAKKLGITKVRYKSTEPDYSMDDSSPSIVRDPNKCVLCGDCVRMCEEIQSVGAIGFAFRGSKATVTPCFGKDIDSVECVNCGQCARVCPTGAISVKSDIDKVWSAIHDSSKTVVAQIAPAVRVAIGESFGLEPGTTTSGQIAAALRRMGIPKVYDTSFTADLTVIEEANELTRRLENGGALPLFTSCCPAWVKFCEQFYPDYVNNLSSCRSPQQMFGSICKEILHREEKIDKKDVVVLSIMPCTAKKYEITRPEFNHEYGRDVDYVVTTIELAKMIEEMGLKFSNLEPEPFDMPFGYKTGAGVIFGNSGGVSEAVLRYAQEKLTGIKTQGYSYKVVRGNENIKEANVVIGEKELRIAIVSGLGNARKLLHSIENKEAYYDFVEVMACPGGCIGGAGQPVPKDIDTNRKRTSGLYANDKMLNLHKPQDNPYVSELYEKYLKEPGSPTAHEFLHTGYKNRRRIEEDSISILNINGENKLDITICFGTGCILKGAQGLLKDILEYIETNDMESLVEINASFCFEKCDRGPVVRIGDKLIEKCSIEKVIGEVEAALSVV